MSALDVSVLGPLRVRVDGRPVELGTGRRRTTLAALVCDAPRVVSIDLLAARVWDDAAPSNPGAAIHTYVSRLRAALRSAGEVDGALAILTDHPGYRLDIDPDQIDAVRFERLLERARELAASNPFAARGLVSEALDLWQGTAYSEVRAPFAERAADHLDSLRTTAEELLVQCELTLGRHEQVVNRAEALVAAAPLREPRHAALMVALYRSGRAAEALDHYERVRTLLGEELGSDPGRELRDLHARILREDATLDPPVRVSTRSAIGARADASGSADVGPAQPPMVGRERELGRVEDAVRTAWAETTPLVGVVVGEAGIGKSRLLEEVAARSRDAGALVVWGRSWQHEGAPALWPWIQALRDLSRLVDPLALDQALDARGHGAERVFGIEATTGMERPNTVESRPGDSIDSSQVRTFDAVTGALEHLATGRRVLVILEDMQWADGASRRLLDYLSTHYAGLGLAVLVSIRSPSEDATTSSREILAALARTGRAVRVALVGLGPEEIRRYVADRTGSTIDDATADALVERTEGNPFFVGELVRLLVADRAPDETVVAAEVPDSIREVVLRRLQGLDEAELEVLRSAAVVGRTFDLDLLRDVSGADDDLVDEAVDHATAAGFLCSEPNRFDQHRFTHALMQQTLVENLGPMRRRRLHQQIASVLRSSEGVSLRQTRMLIHHLAHAGGAANADEAIGLCLEAAETASNSADHAEVEVLLLQALDLAARLDSPRAEEREIDVLVRVGNLYDHFYGVLHPASVAYRARARELARASNSRSHLVAVLNSAASSALGAADFARAESVIHEIRAAAESLDDDLMRAAALLNEGTLAFQQGRLEAAAVTMDGVVELVAGRDLGPHSAQFVTPLEVAVGWRLMANALLHGVTADPTGLAATRALLGSSQPSVATHAAGILALHAVVLDDRATARSLARRALESARATGNQAVGLYLPAVEVWGADDISPEALAAALDPIERPTRLVMRPLLRSLVADAHLRVGRLAVATELWQRSRDEAITTGNLVTVPCVRRRLDALR